MLVLANVCLYLPQWLSYSCTQIVTAAGVTEVVTRSAEKI